MPCGGIQKYSDVDPGPCFLCQKEGADHYCMEWDCMLHDNCIIPFLQTEEGHVVLEHGHPVVISFPNGVYGEYAYHWDSVPDYIASYDPGDLPEGEVLSEEELKRLEGESK